MPPFQFNFSFSLKMGFVLLSERYLLLKGHGLRILNNHTMEEYWKNNKQWDNDNDSNCVLEIDKYMTEDRGQNMGHLVECLYQDCYLRLLIAMYWNHKLHPFYQRYSTQLESTSRDMRQWNVLLFKMLLVLLKKDEFLLNHPSQRQRIYYLSTEKRIPAFIQEHSRTVNCDLFLVNNYQLLHQLLQLEFQKPKEQQLLVLVIIDECQLSSVPSLKEDTGQLLIPPLIIKTGSSLLDCPCISLEYDGGARELNCIKNYSDVCKQFVQDYIGTSRGSSQEASLIDSSTLDVVHPHWKSSQLQFDIDHLDESIVVEYTGTTNEIQCITSESVHKIAACTPLPLRDTLTTINPRLVGEYILSFMFVQRLIKGRQ